MDVSNRSKVVKATLKTKHHNKILWAKKFVSHNFDYDFKDTMLLFEAINTIESVPLRQANRKLAHIGDAALDMVIRMAGYRADNPLGATNELSQRVISNDALTALAQTLGLKRFLTEPSKEQEELYAPRHVKKKLANAMEAIIGAIYLNSGEDLAEVRWAMVAVGMELPLAEIEVAEPSDFDLPAIPPPPGHPSDCPERAPVSALEHLSGVPSPSVKPSEAGKEPRPSLRALCDRIFGRLFLGS